MRCRRPARDFPAERPLAGERFLIPSRLIEAKRDGRAIPEEDLRSFLRDFLSDDLPEYQMSAFLMAVVFQGMTPLERSCLVDEMLHSGSTLSWPDADRPVVDKHSTGGVGDKVSLILAPLAADLGMLVPMMSGRGLGHSGGTLDKLEAIPGFRTDLPLDEFKSVLGRVGCAMIGQTEEIAPLDKRLYSLRNVTGTVPAIPLIAASIMSKKLSEGLDTLVLDVKHGSGAFICGTDAALELARTMVEIGVGYGVNVTALLTAMDRPLGISAGNALEVRECVEVLQGDGPKDLREVTLRLVAEMSLASGLASGADLAYADAVESIDSGRALERFAQLVTAQGGDAAVCVDASRLAQAPLQGEVLAEADGVIQEVAPRPLGWGVVELGGGRRKLGDDIDPSVGFEVLAQTGHAVATGDVLAIVHARDEAGLAAGNSAVREAVLIGEEGSPDSLPLVSHRVTLDGVETLA
jgi:pyrimidine-nucleoside phosphorylase